MSLALLALTALGTKYAGEPFYVGFNARALGMGSAYTALALDPSAVYWNPAGLASAPGFGAMLQHGFYFQGLSYEFGSVSKEGLFGKGSGGGLGFYWLSAGDIPLTLVPDSTRPPGDDNRPVKVANLSFNAYELFFSGAKEFAPGAFGMSLRALAETADTSATITIDTVTGDTTVTKLPSVRALGIGLDVGYSRSFGNLSTGLMLRDVFYTPLFWSTGTTERIYPAVLAGVAYRISRLLWSSDFVFRWDNRSATEAFAFGGVTVTPNVGLELDFTLVQLRGGFEYGSPTAGVGVRFGKFGLDYALLSHSDLDYAHRFSLAGRF